MESAASGEVGGDGEVSADVGGAKVWCADAEGTGAVSATAVGADAAGVDAAEGADVENADAVGADVGSAHRECADAENAVAVRADAESAEAVRADAVRADAATRSWSAIIELRRMSRGLAEVKCCVRMPTPECCEQEAPPVVARRAWSDLLRRFACADRGKNLLRGLSSGTACAICGGALRRNRCGVIAGTIAAARSDLAASLAAMR